MIVQVRADARQIMQHLDAHILQMLRRTDARQQQELRRTISAAGDDHFATRPRRFEPSRRAEFDADRASLLDQHTRGMGVCANDQVRSFACRTKIGGSGAPSTAIVGCRLVVATALLLCAVEIRIPRNAGFDARLQQ